MTKLTDNEKLILECLTSVLESLQSQDIKPTQHELNLLKEVLMGDRTFSILGVTFARIMASDEFFFDVLMSQVAGFANADIDIKVSPRKGEEDVKTIH